MRAYRPSFSDDDLLFLVNTLMPDVADKQRMVRVVREDEEIRDGMLSDEKVVRRLLDDPLSILGVSARLFFAILITRVKTDLERQPFTMERTSRLSMALFDAPQIVELLERKEFREYLTDMLVSFVRVNSFSTAVRVKNGVWRKVRFSDFDIDSLVRYGSAIQESERFPVYKRIADICLFTLGVMPPPEPAEGDPHLQWESMRIAMKRSREDFVQQGVSFYRLAARHKEAEARRLSEVLATLSDKFTLAVKPLSAMSSRYLAPFKDKVFLQ